MSVCTVLQKILKHYSFGAIMVSVKHYKNGISGKWTKTINGMLRISIFSIGTVEMTDKVSFETKTHKRVF